MLMADPVNAAPPVAIGPQTQPGTQDSVKANFAACLGAALIVVGLVAFVSTVTVTSSGVPSSLGFAAIAGVALLSVTLVGIIVLSRAIGVVDATQALGLPAGSIRALLAFALAIVFVASASWTLGGLFDPMGPLVAKTSLPADQLDGFLKPYQSDQYIVVKAEGEDKDNKVSARVYLRREAPQKDVIDLAKQIVTISATVLVTIVGFYFGSKSSSDATRSAGANLEAMRKSVAANQDEGDDGAATEPATPDGIRKAANTVTALAAATAAKLQGLGASPLDDLKNAVAQSNGGEPLKQALASAEASFATMTDRARASQDNGSQATQLAAIPEGADQTALNLINTRAQSSLAGATQANHDFEQAYAAFADARRRILAATAK
jgi:hypothetical protein